jgi:hypothetical protein
MCDSRSFASTAWLLAASLVAGCGGRVGLTAVPGLVGLVAEYDFEDPTNLGKDAAGDSDAVQVVGATQVSGHIGKAVRLEAGYLLLPNPSKLMLATGGDFSLEIWVNTDQPNLNFFTCANPKVHAWGLAEYWPTPTPKMVVNGGDAAEGMTNIYDGRWHHVVGTRSGATLRIYVDGRLEGTSNATKPIVDNDCTVAIGRDGACCESFNGKMDDARLWQRALEADDILAFSRR